MNDVTLSAQKVVKKTEKEMKVGIQSPQYKTLVLTTQRPIGFIREISYSNSLLTKKEKKSVKMSVCSPLKKAH